MSSPGDDLTAISRTLARKAGDDATAAIEFSGNPDISDEIIGFHVQQAIEKWLKALIAAGGEAFEHTHDLARLLSLATDGRPAPPVDTDYLLAMTQYSVPLRYEDLLDAEPLDRERAVALLLAVRGWAEGLLGTD
ncbi:MAG TPA: HEPN domain-containing protein [Solirubrobacterales bacterium]|nr:HEPN domain-containing protein [Solirubrobacterales bacterium]